MQDVSLVSDIVGDCCKLSPAGSGQPYQIHIQTSATGGVPELSVYCLEDSEQFRRQVMQAKRALLGRTAESSAAIGASKDGGSGVGTDRAVAVLERMEKTLNEGVKLLREHKHL